jgi:hypothetical protein
MSSPLANICAEILLPRNIITYQEVEVNILYKNLFETRGFCSIFLQKPLYLEKIAPKNYTISVEMSATIMLKTTGLSPF